MGKKLRGKTGILIVGCMVLAMGLGSCTNSKPVNNTTASGNAVSTEEALGFGEQPQHVNWAKFMMQNEPVRELHCMEGFDEIDYIYPAGGTNLVVLTSRYDYGFGGDIDQSVEAEEEYEEAEPDDKQDVIGDNPGDDYIEEDYDDDYDGDAEGDYDEYNAYEEEYMDVLYDDTTRLYLINVLSDEIITDFAPPENATFIGMRDNGEYIFLNYNDSQYKIYDADLNLKQSVAYPGGRTEYCKAYDCLFYRQEHEFGRIKMDGTQEVLLELDERTFVDDFDLENGMVVVYGKSSDDTAINCYSIYSFMDKDYIYEKDSDYAEYYLCDGFVVTEMDIEEEIESDEESEDDYYNYQTATFVENIRGAELLGGYYNMDNGYIILCSDSGYAYVTAYLNGENEAYTGTQIYIENLQDGGYCDVSSAIGRTDFTLETYMEDIDCFFVATIGAEDHQKLTLIYPEGLDSWKPLETCEATWTGDREYYTSGEDLSSEREYADKLEEQYGVTILIGDEIYNVADNSYYELISTEDEDYETYEWYYNTEDALEVLDRALAFYPEGFFDRFRNYKGEGGLRYILVKDLVNTDGTFEAAGLFYDSGAWYNIVVDVDSLGTTDTLHHEMWHATEQFVCDCNSDAFDQIEWERLNPEGFSYEGDFDNYWDGDSLDQYLIPWDYDNENVDMVYFAEIYGTVTPYEDRSTIMEALLMEGYDENMYGFPTARERLEHYPHIKKKLDYMSKSVEEIFGYVYWE